MNSGSSGSGNPVEPSRPGSPAARLSRPPAGPPANQGIMMENPYPWADATINAAPRYAAGLTELLSVAPYWISGQEWQAYEKRALLIRDFQTTCLRLFRQALAEGPDAALTRWLLGDIPVSFAYHYHQSLKDRHFTLPHFFRTDEARIGQILEIQCPGSLWGELQLTYDYCLGLGISPAIPAPAIQFGRQLTQLLGEPPIVHHFTDHISAPGGMRYFIEKTRPAVRYFGIDRGVHRQDCNFVRGHCFFSIMADDDLKPRLRKVGAGLTYDLPPHGLFDQKAPLALPFWSATRAHFSDEIRQLLVFTTPLLPEGLELTDGTPISIEAFSRLSRTKRAYYLKYAGTDGSRCFGSKAVYRLSNMNPEDCLALLRQCVSEYSEHGVWILQAEVIHDDEVTCIQRDNTCKTQKMRAKFSGFYGPGGFIGALAMHRHHYKVHGQDDTVISCVLPQPEDPLSG